MKDISAGQRFRAALADNKPLQIVGTINAYCALLAEQEGHQAIYLSGAGVANASFGLPDLGMTSLNDVCEDARRITAASDLPLLVDIDTGWGGYFNIKRTITELERAGVAAVHIEDQISQKRCGHRPNKALVSTEEMQHRIKACVEARNDDNFFILARTDACAVEGFDASLARALAYQAAGADAIFAEAMPDLASYEKYTSALDIPVLANITEFGQTPYFTVDELASVGIGMVLYPLSAYRAMSKAAIDVYHTIKTEGTQTSLLKAMQTRQELYATLNYHSYEEELDKVIHGTNSNKT